jgi:hypothetical protein
VACTARVSPARIASDRATPSSEANEDDQLS